MHTTQNPLPHKHYLQIYVIEDYSPVQLAPHRHSETRRYAPPECGVHCRGGAWVPGPVGSEEPLQKVHRGRAPTAGGFSHDHFKLYSSTVALVLV